MDDEILKAVRPLKEYKMGDQKVDILCDADDAVLIKESERPFSETVTIIQLHSKVI